MRVLGVDPGTLVMGFGIIESDNTGLHIIESGCYKFKSKEMFNLRLKKVYDAISELIAEFRPDEFVIESLFYAKNPKVALKMGHARGVAVVAAVNHEIPVYEYSPREIKQSVAGNGAASKEQVQRMLCHLFKLQVVPETYDASDALAVAYCHLNRTKIKI